MSIRIRLHARHHATSQPLSRKNTTFRDRYMPAFRAFYETHEHNRMGRSRSGYVGYIYRYVDAGDCTVYVGQTTQELEQRDDQHFNSTRGAFDRAYTDRSEYTIRLLDTQTFATEEARARWLDECEIHWIDRYDTYDTSS